MADVGLLGNFDPAQLQALLAQFSPSADDEKAARMRAITAAGLAMMGAKKGQEWQALGHAGLLGLQAKDQYVQEQQQRRISQMAQASGLMGLKEKMQAMQDDTAYRQAMAARQGGQQQAAPVAPPQMAGPPPMGDAGGSSVVPPPGAAPPPVQPRLSTSKMSDYQRAIADAQYLEAKGVAPKYVEQAYAKAEKLRPELSRQESLTDPATGQRVRVNFYKDGSHEVLPFAPDAEKAVQVNRGGQIDFVDPFKGQPIPGGGSYPTTMDPAQADASKRGWAAHGLAVNADKRASANEGANQWETDVARGIQVNKRSGESRSITQGGNPIGSKDAEAKANQMRDRLDMADRVIAIVDKAIPMVGYKTTGMTGAAIGMVPGSEAYDLRAAVDTVKANLGFEQLSALRAASPTGGALGQVSDVENKMLQATVANLDANQSEKQLRENLKKVNVHLKNVKALIDGKNPRAAESGKSNVIDFSELPK